MTYFKAKKSDLIEEIREKQLEYKSNCCNIPILDL